MQVNYRISEQDYVNAMKLYARMSLWRIVVVIVGVALLGALAVFGNEFVRPIALGGLIFVAVAVLGARWILLPLLHRRHYRQYKTIQAELSAELLAEGVRFSSPDAMSVVKWDKVHKWREDEHYILIYLSPRLFHIVLKSLGSQGFDLAGLTDALRRHVGAAR